MDRFPKRVQLAGFFKDPEARKNIPGLEEGQKLNVEHYPITIKGQRFPDAVRFTTEEGKLVGHLPESTPWQKDLVQRMKKGSQFTATAATFAETEIEGAIYRKPIVEIGYTGQGPRTKQYNAPQFKTPAKAPVSSVHGKSITDMTAKEIGGSMLNDAKQLIKEFPRKHPIISLAVGALATLVTLDALTPEADYYERGRDTINGRFNPNNHYGEINGLRQPVNPWQLATGINPSPLPSGPSTFSSGRNAPYAMALAENILGIGFLAKSTRATDLSGFRPAWAYKNMRDFSGELGQAKIIEADVSRYVNSSVRAFKRMSHDNLSYFVGSEARLTTAVRQKHNLFQNLEQFIPQTMKSKGGTTQYAMTRNSPIKNAISVPHEVPPHPDASRVQLMNIRQSGPGGDYENLRNAAAKMEIQSALVSQMKEANSIGSNSYASYLSVTNLPSYYRPQVVMPKTQSPTDMGKTIDMAPVINKKLGVKTRYMMQHISPIYTSNAVRAKNLQVPEGNRIYGSRRLIDVHKDGMSLMPVVKAGNYEAMPRGPVVSAAPYTNRGMQSNVSPKMEGIRNPESAHGFSMINGDNPVIVGPTGPFGRFFGSGSSNQAGWPVDWFKWKTPYAVDDKAIQSANELLGKALGKDPKVVGKFLEQTSSKLEQTAAMWDDIYTGLYKKYKGSKAYRASEAVEQVGTTLKTLKSTYPDVSGVAVENQKQMIKQFMEFKDINDLYKRTDPHTGGISKRLFNARYRERAGLYSLDILSPRLQNVRRNMLEKQIIPHYRKLGVVMHLLDEAVNERDPANWSAELRRVAEKSNLKPADLRTVFMHMRDEYSAEFLATKHNIDRVDKIFQLKQTGAEFSHWLRGSPAAIGETHLARHYNQMHKGLMNTGMSSVEAHSMLQREGVDTAPENVVQEWKGKYKSKVVKATGPFSWIRNIIEGEHSIIDKNSKVSFAKAFYNTAKLEFAGFFSMFKNIWRGQGTFFQKLLTSVGITHGMAGFKSFGVASQMLKAGYIDINATPVPKGTAPDDLMGEKGSARYRLGEKQIELGNRIRNWSKRGLKTATGLSKVGYKFAGGFGKVIQRVGVNLMTVFNSMAVWSATNLAGTYGSWIGGFATEMSGFALGGAGFSLAYNTVGKATEHAMLARGGAVYKQAKGAPVIARSSKLASTTGTITGMIAGQVAHLLLQKLTSTVGYAIFGKAARKMNMPPGALHTPVENPMESHILIDPSVSNVREEIDPSGMNLSMFGSEYDSRRDPALNIETPEGPVYKPVSFGRTVGLPQRMWESRNGATKSDTNHPMPAPPVRQRVDRVAV